MKTIHDILLITHIATGTIALLAGTTVILLRKGTALHRRLGATFVLGQGGASVAAILLTFLHPNRMLLLIGLFSLHLVLSGYRAARQRIGGRSFIDVLQPGVGAVIALAMLLSGQVVLIVYGAMAAFLVVGDLRGLVAATKGTLPEGWWLRRHIGYMVGGYISTLTAFLVVNLSWRLGIIIWILPTVVLVPLIVRWTRIHSPRPGKTSVASMIAGVLLLGNGVVQARPYVEGGHTPHRSAPVTRHSLRGPAGASVQFIFGSNSQWRATAGMCVQNDSKEKFVKDLEMTG